MLLIEALHRFHEFWASRQGIGLVIHETYNLSLLFHSSWWTDGLLIILQHSSRMLIGLRLLQGIFYNL